MPHHWIDYPTLERTVAIIRRRVPGQPLPRYAVGDAVQRLRTLDCRSLRAVAEAINWTLARDLLGLAELNEDAVASTLGSVLKYREDLDAAHERGLAWVAGSA